MEVLIILAALAWLTLIAWVTLLALVAQITRLARVAGLSDCWRHEGHEFAVEAEVFVAACAFLTAEDYGHLFQNVCALLLEQFDGELAVWVSAVDIIEEGHLSKRGCTYSFRMAAPPILVPWTLRYISMFMRYSFSRSVKMNLTP